MHAALATGITEHSPRHFKVYHRQSDEWTCDWPTIFIMQRPHTDHIIISSLSGDNLLATALSEDCVCFIIFIA